MVGIFAANGFIDLPYPPFKANTERMYSLFFLVIGREDSTSEIALFNSKSSQRTK